ncbi:MAG: class I SAM-dependent methyltransferase [Porticoccaceae bacterium]
MEQKNAKPQNRAKTVWSGATRPGVALSTLAALLILQISSVLAADQHAEDAPDTALKAVIASTDHRTPEFTARDGARHPYETLRFFGLHAGMTVVEIWPSTGWYTEILAPYLREKGKLYAAHFPADTAVKYFRDNRTGFLAKLAAKPAVYDRVTVTSFNPPTAVDIAPAGSADLVLTFRNVHNWYMRGGGERNVVAAFAAMNRALKPGGVLGIVEHRLASHRGPAEQEQSGYMREDFVIRAAEQAGFRLVAKSEINANPHDTTDYPEGVWTLPPTLRLGPLDRERYVTIGESDRMTLKFVKP